MNQNLLNKTVVNLIVKVGLLALILIWCFKIISPFISIILWGIILAMAFYPLHKRVTSWFGGRKKLASAAIVLVGLAILVVPSWLFIGSMIEGLINLKHQFDAGTLTIPPPTPEVANWPLVGPKVHELWLGASQNIEQFVVNHSDQVAKYGGKVAQQLASISGGILALIVSFLLSGVLLALDNLEAPVHKIAKKIVGQESEEFVGVISKTVNNVVKGVIGVAFIQSVLVGLGFILAGVPFAGLWTIFVLILAILQISPFIVVLPIIIYLFSVSETLPAVLWTIYLIAAGMCDNILKPILLGKGAPVPMLVIFIGVIGGFIFSGFIGLFTGAIVVSIGYRLISAWVNEPEELSLEESPKVE